MLNKEERELLIKTYEKTHDARIKPHLGNFGGKKMRKINDISVFSTNKQLMLWFIMSSFPESFCAEKDISIMEFVQLNYDIDINIVHNFTEYYDGVFDINDGYVDNPNAIMISLDLNKELYVEFHPGDTLYFLNDKILGSTGPHYQIRKVSFLSFITFCDKLSLVEKLLLLPMVFFKKEEEAAFLSTIKPIIKHSYVKEDDVDIILSFIAHNCREQSN